PQSAIGEHGSKIRCYTVGPPVMCFRRSDSVPESSHRSRHADAHYRLKLLCGDEGLLAKATSAVEAAAGMHEARDDAELRSRGETAKRLLDDFVTAAAALLR